MDLIRIQDLNDIIRGYLLRACKEAEYSNEQMWKIYGSMNLAFDDMTIEEAMEEWNKFCDGKIKFHKECEED